MERMREWPWCSPITSITVILTWDLVLLLPSSLEHALFFRHDCSCNPFLVTTMNEPMKKSNSNHGSYSLSCLELPKQPRADHRDYVYVEGIFSRVSIVGSWCISLQTQVLSELFSKITKILVYNMAYFSSQLPLYQLRGALICRIMVKLNWILQETCCSTQIRKALAVDCPLFLPDP